MSQFDDLSTDELARVQSKLSALHERTWKTWEYSVTRQPGASKAPALLEIIVDGRIAQPIELPPAVEMPAEVICQCLESFAKRYMGSAEHK